MKKLCLLFALLSATTAANEQIGQVDEKFVKEIYEYCLSMQSIDYLNKELLLECINLELKHFEHSQFQSIEEIEAIAKSGDEGDAAAPIESHKE